MRVAARRSKDGPQARRLLALATIYEEASRTEATRIGGVTVQIVRDWVVKCNAEGPAGLIDLIQWLWDEFALSVSRPTPSRELRALGYGKLSARPRRHAQDGEAVEGFKRGLCRRGG